MTRQDLRHQGEAMLRTLFGSAAQPAGLANLLTEAANGGIWTRPGLALPDRLICSIAALGVGPRPRALRRHIGALLEQGLGAEAIREVLVQASLYSGFSAAEETLPLAGEVFAERGIRFPAEFARGSVAGGAGPTRSGADGATARRLGERGLCVAGQSGDR